MAQRRVSHSPRCMPERMAAPVPVTPANKLAGDPGGVLVRRMRPMKAVTAPRKTMALGLGDVAGATRGVRLRVGTMTTTRAVRKADFDGVVWARPVVWKL